VSLKKIILWSLGVVALGLAGVIGYSAIFGLGWMINPGPPVAGASAAQARLVVTKVADGLENPWGLALLPDGRFLVTERPGRLRLVTRSGKVSAPLGGVPKVVAEGQGGLLDVVLDPDFATNRTIYLSYSEADPKNPDLAATAVARAILGETALSRVSVIFRQTPKVEGSLHWGSRIAFDPKPADGKTTLFIALGERFEQAALAQTLGNTMGKVVRIRADGSIPADNPYVGQQGKLPAIWSYGHRNIQSAAINPATAALWTIEHGPRGGDELNIPRAGINHGWPVITYGHDYMTNKPLGQGTRRADVAEPVRMWKPSIAPSGMAFLTSDKYPGWKGNLFVGSLAHRQLVRLELSGDRVVAEHRLLRDLDTRIRDVRQGSDGLLYLLTDSDDGQILRLDPQ
jgi:aldose sugar dehydrogenase